MILRTIRPLSACLAAVVVLAAAGCAGKPQVAPAPAEPPAAPAESAAARTMRCGDQLVRLAIEGERARLEAGGETFELAAVMASAGARYLGTEDPTTTVWVSGSRVRVTLRGKEYPECVPVPDGAAALLGAEWVVEDIAGAGIVDRSHATLIFGADGRVSGSGSCNSYSAGYMVTGDSLTITQAVSTLKACVPALMSQEEKFMGLLRDVRTFAIAPDGALVLRTADGRTIKARRG